MYVPITPMQKVNSADVVQSLSNIHTSNLLIATKGKVAGTKSSPDFLEEAGLYSISNSLQTILDDGLLPLGTMLVMRVLRSLSKHGHTS